MTPALLIQKARSEGVLLARSTTGTILATGEQMVVDRWLPILRENKPDILAALSNAYSEATGLVREFIEVDGLTLAEAEALALLSIAPRSSSEWLRLIANLDGLIEEYCALAGVPPAAKARILATRFGQALSSIPATLAWFRIEVETMRSAKFKTER